MTNCVEVFFALQGDYFNPDEFTRISGLTPTDTILKGTTRRFGSGNYTFGRWELSLGKMDGDVLLVGDAVDSLIERLEPYTDLIAAAIRSEGLYAVLQIVLTVSVDESISTPALGFSKGPIAFLNTVGAEIDVDIYRG